MVGAWLHGKLRKEPKSGDLGPALGFIGSSFGLLLGLLVVFGANHYTSARSEAEDEATAVVAMFDEVGVFPPATREHAEHSIVCYIRSVIEDDWKAMERGQGTDAIETRRAGGRVLRAIHTLPLSPERFESAASQATTEMIDARRSRQQLLFLSRPAIPTVLWVVIFVGAAVLVFLITGDLVARPETKVAGLVAVAVMLTVVIGVLVSLDRPFSPLARIDPTAMQRALELLGTDQQGEPFLRPCSLGTGRS
jgi:hypothetical protein